MTSPCWRTTSPGCQTPACRSTALSDLPIVGVKDSSGSADRLLDEVTHYSGATYVGSSALLSLAGPLGGTGAILAWATWSPSCPSGPSPATPARSADLADTHLRVKAGGPRVIKEILATTRGTSAGPIAPPA